MLNPITHGSILAVYLSASQAELLEGYEWYTRASGIAFLISQTYGITKEQAAGVIAALSPNNRWERNTLDAEALVKVVTRGGDPRSIKVSTFHKNKAKAVAILKGSDPLEVLGGLKVRAFYECIMGNDDAVCVDGHAYAIWLGQRVPTSKTPKISAKLYETIANDYRLATAQVNRITSAGVVPAQVQAVTWVVWRNLIRGGAINE